MAFTDVMLGLQTWTDYVSTGEQTRAFDSALSRQQTAQVLAHRDTQLAIRGSASSFGQAVDTGMDRLAGGIAQLNADFNLMMSEVVWMLQRQDARLESIVDVLEAPLDTAAKELRRRGERAYESGWYDEALTDLLESAKLNYQNFSVHRSIGNIYLFHRRDVATAVECFRRAAKYARRVNRVYAAEAHYFAGVALGVLKVFHEAGLELQAATELNPQFYEAFYMLAGVAALQHDRGTAVDALRHAIEGAPGYFSRARQDLLFDEMRSSVQGLLDELSVDALGVADGLLATVSRDVRDFKGARLSQERIELLEQFESSLAAAHDLRRDPSYANIRRIEPYLRDHAACLRDIKRLDELYAARASTTDAIRRARSKLDAATVRLGKVEPDPPLKDWGIGWFVMVGGLLGGFAGGMFGSAIGALNSGVPQLAGALFGAIAAVFLGAIAQARINSPNHPMRTANVMRRATFAQLTGEGATAAQNLRAIESKIQEAERSVSERRTT